MSAGANAGGATTIANVGTVNAGNAAPSFNVGGNPGNQPGATYSGFARGMVVGSPANMATLNAGCPTAARLVRKFYGEAAVTCGPRPATANASTGALAVFENTGT
jgi:hypothetical protein